MAFMDGKLIFGENIRVVVGRDVGHSIDLGSFSASGVRHSLLTGEPVWWVNLVTGTAVGESSMHFCMNHHLSDEISGSGAIILARSPDFYAEQLVEGMYWISVLPLTNVHGLRRYIGARVSVPGPGVFDGLHVTSYLTTAPPTLGGATIQDWRP